MILAIIIIIIDFFILNLSSNFRTSTIAIGKNTIKNNENSMICGKYEILIPQKPFSVICLSIKYITS